MRSPGAALIGLLLAVMVVVSIASAQQSGRVYKIGRLSIGSPGFVVPPVEKWTGDSGIFRDTLRDNGFVVGKNLVIEVRHAHGDAARLAAEAEAFVASGVDVIMPNGTPPTVAAMQATKTIPIVFWGVGDPVEKGIVSSLARPGGNVTGQAVLIAMAKQWQLLHEVAPSVRRGGFLGNAANRPAKDKAAAFDTFWFEQMKTNAATVGIEPTPMIVFSLSEIEARFAELASAGAAGVVVVNDALFVSPEWRSAIMELALKYRLPTSCAQVRLWAVSGCLVSYVEDWNAIQQGAALQIVKVLRETPPGMIPVEQPTSYKLVINAKTAKALDITVPPSLLAAAEEVIE